MSNKTNPPEDSTSGDDQPTPPRNPRSARNKANGPADPYADVKIRTTAALDEALAKGPIGEAVTQRLEEYADFLDVTAGLARDDATTAAELAAEADKAIDTLDPAADRATEAAKVASLLAKARVTDTAAKKIEQAAITAHAVAEQARGAIAEVAPARPAPVEEIAHKEEAKVGPAPEAPKVGVLSYTNAVAARDDARRTFEVVSKGAALAKRKVDQTAVKAHDLKVKAEQAARVAARISGRGRGGLPSAEKIEADAGAMRAGAVARDAAREHEDAVRDATTVDRTLDEARLLVERTEKDLDAVRASSPDLRTAARPAESAVPEPIGFVFESERPRMRLPRGRDILEWPIPDLVIGGLVLAVVMWRYNLWGAFQLLLLGLLMALIALVGKLVRSSAWRVRDWMDNPGRAALTAGLGSPILLFCLWWAVMRTADSNVEIVANPAPAAAVVKVPAPAKALVKATAKPAATNVEAPAATPAATVAEVPTGTEASGAATQ
jgi:hypothetical protein